VTDDGMVRQLGPRRRADGSERARLTILEGDAIESPPAGARALALVPGHEDVRTVAIYEVPIESS
jgi:hypothetical protein